MYWFFYLLTLKGKSTGVFRITDWCKCPFQRCACALGTTWWLMCISNSYVCSASGSRTTVVLSTLHRCISLPPLMYLCKCVSAEECVHACVCNWSLSLWLLSWKAPNHTLNIMQIRCPQHFCLLLRWSELSQMFLLRTEYNHEWKLLSLRRGSHFFRELQTFSWFSLGPSWVL